QHLCGVEFCGHAARAAVLDRVDAIEAQLAALARPVARFGQADRVDRAEAHDMQSAVFFEPEHPGFRAALAHLQEQAAAVAVETAPLYLLHPDGRQLADHPRRAPVIAGFRHTHFYAPLPILGSRTVADDGGWCKTNGAETLRNSRIGTDGGEH